MLELPQVDTGVLVLASLAVVPVAPRLGIAVHAAALGLAIILDQTRLQPEFVSLALLMVGTLDSATAALIARTHLVTLWFYAGLHKLVSPGYYIGQVPQMLRGLVGLEPPWPLVFDLVRGGLALAEIGLGIMAVVPRTRRIAAPGACALHLGILGYLALRVRGNAQLWPWNLALALSGPYFLRTWRSSLTRDLGAAPRWAGVTVAGLLVMPVGFYAGYVDAYVAHCLYCRNAPQARIVSRDGVSRHIETSTTLNVPFPPTQRGFLAYFAREGRPGERLIVEDPRWWLRGRREWSFEEATVTGGSPPPAGR
jgi:hypothetical protein